MSKQTSKIVNNWSDVPAVWKKIPAIKPKRFVVSPYDKDFQSIVSPYIGKDSLRPVMSGIFFDDKGAVVTDAHKLLYVAYDKSEFSGIYPSTYAIKQAEKRGDDPVKSVEGTYPKYKSIIPTEAKFSASFNPKKLLQYINVALNYANKTTRQIAFKYGEGKEDIIGFNGNFLKDVIESLMKLDKSDQLWIHLTYPSRAGIFSFDKTINYESDTWALLMPVMLKNEGIFNQLGAHDSYTFKVEGQPDTEIYSSLNVYFDFQDGEIHNADGSVAKFTENVESSDNDIPQELIDTLARFIARGTTNIPILECVCVDAYGIRATTLEANVVFDNQWDIPQGIYSIQNGALRFEMEMQIDDFPKLPEIKEEPSLEMKEEALEFYVGKAIKTKGSDDLRPVMSALCLDIKSGYGGENVRASLVATDAHTLVHFSLTDEITFFDKNPAQYLLGNTTELYNFLKYNDSEKAVLSFQSKEVEYNKGVWYKVVCGSAMFIARLTEGKYPNYEAVIPRLTNRKITVNAKELYPCLVSAKAKQFQKDNGNATYIEVVDGKAIQVNSDSVVAGYKKDKAPRVENPLCDVVVTAEEEEKEIDTTQSFFLIMPVMGESDIFNMGYKLFLRGIEIMGQDVITFYNQSKERAFVGFSSGLKFQSAGTHKKPSVKKTEKAKAEAEQKKAEEAKRQAEEAKAKEAEALANAEKAKEAKINQGLVDAPKPLLPVGRVDVFRIGKLFGLGDLLIRGQVIELYWNKEGKDYPALKMNIKVPHYTFVIKADKATDPDQIGKTFEVPEAVVDELFADTGDYHKDDEWLNSIATSSKKPRVEKVTYKVRLGAVNNKDDFRSKDEKKYIFPYLKPVVSIEDAKDEVRMFIQENNLHPQNWIHGEVFEGKKMIGYIDFNGKFIEYKADSIHQSFPPSKKELDDFLDYVDGFYGKQGIFKKDFSNKGFTKEEIKTAIDQYIQKITESGDYDSWGLGDSVDREHVRVILEESLPKMPDLTRENIDNAISGDSFWTHPNGIDGQIVKEATKLGYLQMKGKAYAEWTEKGKEHFGQATPKTEEPEIKLSSLKISDALKGSDFWMKPDSRDAKIINEATKLGYVRRLSHTQAEWTDEGAKHFGFYTKPGQLPVIKKPATKKPENPKAEKKAEPLKQDYKDALEGAKTLLKFASKEEKPGIQNYIDGLTTMLKFMK